MDGHHIGSYWNISKSIEWIAMAFCTDIHVPQKMKPTEFALGFPLAPGAV